MNLYWNLAEGTTAKAQGTAAISVGALGYLKAWGQFYKTAQANNLLKHEK